MRRSEFNKRPINRNNEFIYNRNTDSAGWNNIMPPGFFLDQMWMETAETTTGVQIVELKSDDSEKPDEARSLPRNSAWSFDSHEHSQPQHQKNVSDAEERRVKLETDLKTNYFRSLHDEYDSAYHNDYCYGDFNEMPENLFINHDMNYFTIIDHNNVNTDSSEEDYANIEEVNSESMSEQWNGPGQYDRDMLNYDIYDPQSEMQQRTVWIYSYKNKRLLAENDYELVNIPSNVSSIDESENVQQKIASPHRATTPVPPVISFVSRMNLTASSTLPTVAEVTEPKPSSSNHTYTRDNTLPKKPINSWFLSEHASPTRSIGPQKTKNVVNWMALSPRGDRHKLKNSCTKNKPVADSHKVQYKNALRNTIRPSNKIHPMPVLSDQSSQTVEFCNFQSNAVIETPKPLERRQTCFERARASVGVSCNLPSSQKRSNDHNETNSEEDSPQDRGDHNRPRRRIPAKLRIRLSPKSLAGSFISAPMENLESSEWIGEDKAIQTTLLTAQEYQRYQDEDIPPTLLIRNMSLLKPPEWAEYLPITESVPSLQLSLNSDSIDEPLPWYRRLYRVMFKCCLVCK